MDPQISQPEQHAGMNDDGDSAYGADENEDDTVSLSSSVAHGFYDENGRTYYSHDEKSYWGAVDDAAKDMQDLGHHIYRITFGGELFYAPLDQPKTILDVGTGTGIWAIDMADMFPAAEEVIGTDLSPIQPEWVPQNCEFQIDDATMEWTYPHDHFDFVHVREMFGSVHDWEYFFSQAYRHIKPGGWIEIVERSVKPISSDGTVGPNHFFTIWGETVLECGQKSGKTFEIWKDTKGYIEKAGFVNVVEVPFRWPMNGWPANPCLQKIGRWNQVRLLEGIEGFMLRLLTKVLKWSYERAQLFLAEMRRNLKDSKTHAYLPGTVVYGQKPWQL